MKSVLTLIATLFISSSSFGGQAGSFEVNIPVFFEKITVEAACVADGHEDPIPYLWFSKKDYRKIAELEEKGLKRKFVVGGSPCLDKFRDDWTWVIPFSKADVIDAAVKENKAYKSYEIIFYSYVDSQDFFDALRAELEQL